MNTPRWLASPLMGTAGVLVALALIAIPLHRLTSAPQVITNHAAREKTAKQDTHAVIRLKLLTPTQRVSLESPDGIKLLDLTDLPAGESEYDSSILLDNRRADLTLRVHFGETESAAFLTVMPDGLDEQTHYLIGTGDSAETLTYAW